MNRRYFVLKRTDIVAQCNLVNHYNINRALYSAQQLQTDLHVAKANGQKLCAVHVTRNVSLLITSVRTDLDSSQHMITIELRQASNFDSLNSTLNSTLLNLTIRSYRQV